mgnify:CR=1 FL=1
MTPDPRSLALIAHGATYRPANVKTGQPYWRLVEAQGPLQMGGRHHIYVDVLGEAGQRLTGIPVRFFWADGDTLTRTEAKPGDPAATNFPMYAGGNAYGCRVDSGLPSDELFGMGLVPHAPHVSYRLVFKRTLAGGDAPPQEPPTPPSVTLEYALSQIQHWLDVAKDFPTGG